uniref:SWIM-type domain-containing protein n=1 Tax=Lactuca sativa TaxID=4236 RepID=A0A9R1WJ06_LACSA|nr:hypothetical protein LSAT_V11C100029920 [Lactuca sativa]
MIIYNYINSLLFSCTIGRAVSDVLISNMCEVFNGKIEKRKDKPGISNKEDMQCHEGNEKGYGTLTPTATNILDVRKVVASQYIARWNGRDMYHVTGPLQDQHVVDVRKQTCSCRKWELIGIPCRHAIATLNEMSKDSEDELDIYKWVGRPKKKRRQSEGERLSKKQRGSQGDGFKATQEEESHRPTNNGVQKLSRKHISVTCSKCKNKGHKSRTCKRERWESVQEVSFNEVGMTLM